MEISVIVNDEPRVADVDWRLTLAELVRDELGLTGTHIGCCTGNCGACTVELDGAIVKSCCVLAGETDGRHVRTIESLGGEHPLRKAFAAHQALQCGFCTPGMIMSAKALLETDPDPSEEAIRRGLTGNLCRCTGYAPIIDAVRSCAS
jgi:carbon-monoxide dehydrogenase small subunit